MLFIHSHDLILRRTEHTRPVCRGSVNQDGVFRPADPSSVQAIRKHGFNGRVPGPFRLLDILVRHEHDGQPPPSTRRDLRGPGIPPPAPRDIHHAAVPPGPAVVVRDDVLEAEMRPFPRRLEDHDEGLAPRRGVPRLRDALHAVAQVLCLRVAPQTRRLRAPRQAAVERVDAEGLLVVPGELARVRQLDEGRAVGRGREAHERLPEPHAAGARRRLLRRLRREAPRPPPVRAVAHRDAEVRGLAVGPAGVVAEGGEHRRPLARYGHLQQKPVVDVPGPPRDLAVRRERPPVVGAPRYLEDVHALQHPGHDAQERAVGEAAETRVRPALVQRDQVGAQSPGVGSVGTRHIWRRIQRRLVLLLWLELGLRRRLQLLLGFSRVEVFPEMAHDFVSDHSSHDEQYDELRASEKKPFEPGRTRDMMAHFIAACRVGVVWR